MPSRATERINFGKIKEIIAPPNLIELQTNSYRGVPAAGRRAHPAQERRPPGRVHGGLSRSKATTARCVLDFHSYEIGEPEERLARMPARRHHLRRAALRHLPAQGREGHQGGEGVHGRTAAHDPARHVRHQRRRARHRQPAASLARPGLRGHPASERQDAAFASASFPIAAPGTKRSSTPATCSTSISTAKNAAGNFSPRRFSARLASSTEGKKKGTAPTPTSSRCSTKSRS